MLDWLRPSKKENGLMFGLAWSAAGIMLAITGLTSCSYLIPEDERPPRYNTVVGPRHAPVLNHAVGENAPDPNAPTSVQAQEVFGEGGVPPSFAAPDTSLAPTPGAGGFADHHQAPPFAPSGAAPSAVQYQGDGQPIQHGHERNAFEKGRDWIFGDDAEIGAPPVPVGSPLPPGARHTPDEKNADENTSVALGFGEDYPELNSVPDRPESLLTKSKLEQAHEALKIDKARAEREAQQLQNQTEQDPDSLLKQYRNGTLKTSPVPGLPDIPLSDEGAFFFGEDLPSVPKPEPKKVVNIVRGTQTEEVVVR